jgi:hypothetical protein
MITIQKQPYEVMFSRNPVVWKFIGTDSEGNPYVTYNVRAELRGLFVPIVANDTIEVQWTDAGGVVQSVIFTAKDNPIIESQIPTNASGYNNYGDLYQGIADKMNNHPIAGTFLKFSQTFNITSQSLWAEAIDDDPDYQIEFIINMTNGGSFTITNSIAPTSNFPTNYKMLLEVFFDAGSGYLKASEHEAYANNSGEFAFDISDILDAELESMFPEMPLPAFADNEPIDYDIVRPYFIRYREDYEDIESPLWTSSSEKKCLYGGISKSMFAQGNFFDNLQEYFSLLTWYPAGKNISTNQPEWIAFYNFKSGAVGLMLEVKWYDENGNEDIVFKFGGLTETVASKNVMLVPVGYNQIELDEPTAVRYTVRLISRGEYEENGGNIEYLSQPREFYIDRDYYKEKRYVMYLNGFNCPETLRCVGNFTTELSVDRQKRGHILSPEYTASSSEVSQYDQDFSNEFTYRSGYLSKAEVTALQELLIYGKAWEVSSDQVFGLDITTNKFPVTETRKFLNSIEFNCTTKLSEGSYSGEIITEAFYIVDDEGSAIIDDEGSAILLGP